MSERERKTEILNSFTQLPINSQRDLLAELARSLNRTNGVRARRGRESLERARRIRAEIGPISGSTTDLIREIRER